MWPLFQVLQFDSNFKTATVQVDPLTTWLKILKTLLWPNLGCWWWSEASEVERLCPVSASSTQSQPPLVDTTSGMWIWVSLRLLHQIEVNVRYVVANSEDQIYFLSCNERQNLKLDKESECLWERAWTHYQLISCNLSMTVYAGNDDPHNTAANFLRPQLQTQNGEDLGDS